MNNLLPMAKWGIYETARIAKLFKGFESDWEKASLKSVKESLKNELFPMQNYECAYCRRRIINEIGRVEVDHILPKATYPHFTFERINLVLTCKRCNHAKGDHDPYVGSGMVQVYPSTPTIFKWVHPYFHLYSDHISIDQSGIYSTIGGSTDGFDVIEKCKLNTIKRVVENSEIRVLSQVSDLCLKITSIIGIAPSKSDQEIANIFRSKFSSTIEDKELLELIASQRNADLNSMLKLLTRIASSI